MTIALFLLALIPRLAYLSGSMCLSGSDYGLLLDTELQRSALSLAERGVLGNIWSKDSGPSAHVSPLYPTFVAGIHALAGSRSMLAFWLQGAAAAVVSSLAICLLPLVAQSLQLRILSGIGGAALLALSPLNLWWESSGSWEQPFAALALVLLVCMVSEMRKAERLDMKAWIGFGVAAGVTNLLSAALLPVIASLSIVLVLENKSRWPGVAIAALVALIVGVPWLVRNLYQFQSPIITRSNLGLELQLGNREGADGSTFHSSWDLRRAREREPEGDELAGGVKGFAQLHPFTSPEERDRLLSMGEIPYMKAKGRLAMDWIRDNPGRFLGLTIRRWTRYWLPDSELWPPRVAFRGFRSIALSLLSVLALLGIIRLFSVCHRNRWLILLALLSPCTAYVITHVSPRFRYPVLGISALLATDFVLAATSRRSRIRHTRFYEPMDASRRFR